MAQAAKHIVTDRKRSTARVLRVVRRFAASTARELRKLVAPALEEGEEMPDFARLQELFARSLEEHLRQLVSADDALRELVAQDARLRRRRDEAARAVHSAVGDLRTALTGRLGREACRNFLGLRGETSRDPVVLLKQAGRAVQRLRDPEKLPPKGAITELERERRAALLANAAGTLRRANSRIQPSAKRLDAARRERRRALADFNLTFIRIASVFRHFYHATGRDDLADRVRPSKQYPGRTAAEIQERRRPVAARAEAAARLLLFTPLRRIARAFGRRLAATADRRGPLLAIRENRSRHS